MELSITVKQLIIKVKQVYLNEIFLVDKNQGLIELTIILDTGFNGELTLPEKYLNQCNFIRLGDEEYILADGSIVKEDTYQGEIVINKKPFLVKLSLIDDDEALLGNALLIDKIVQLNFKDNKIEIVD
jgi:clan AA aspartic protease